jgi:hypothetical protein
MFGHDDNQNQQNGDTGAGAPTVDPSANDPLAQLAAEAHEEHMATKTDDSASTGTSNATNDDLLNIKQEALQHLTPLVGHLEQNPEEKFRTLMMMIQASDDQTKLKEAFDTAKQITDDKARAQALLDIINEINYFTQHHNS